MESGIRRSCLPWEFPDAFFLLTYCGTHSRLIFRAVAEVDADDDESGSADDAWDAIPTTDVMFVGVRSLRVDVSLQGLVVREAAVSEAVSRGIELGDGERLFLVETASGVGWVVAEGVWWTRNAIPYNAPSPLLADLDFDNECFSWEESGALVFVT